MARLETTRTHYENISITPKAAHGDVTGNVVLGVYGLDGNPASDTSVFSVDDTGSASVGGTLGVTGASTLAAVAGTTGTYSGVLTGKQHTTGAAISAGTASPTTTTYPSGSVVKVTAATCDVTLPAVASSAGVRWTVIMAGATSLTISGATACLLTLNLTAKTHIVYATAGSILNNIVDLYCDGTNWFLASVGAASSSS